MATMSNRACLAMLATVTLLSGCAGRTLPQDASLRSTAGASRRPPAWQTVIRDADRKRLAGLWTAWTRSLADAQQAGQREAVSGLGVMAVPDGAVPEPPPAPGAYRCRSVKLGNREDGSIRSPSPSLMAGMFRPCTFTLRKGLLHFDQGIGEQRVAGALYPDGDRHVFLGAMALAGERGMMAYGADAERDQVGVLRGLGERHWRLELPWPMWQSNLQVIEIVPA